MPRIRTNICKIKRTRCAVAWGIPGRWRCGSSAGARLTANAPQAICDGYDSSYADLLKQKFSALAAGCFRNQIRERSKPCVQRAMLDPRAARYPYAQLLRHPMQQVLGVIQFRAKLAGITVSDKFTALRGVNCAGHAVHRNRRAVPISHVCGQLLDFRCTKPVF
jgi:hypothetical protein